MAAVEKPTFVYLLETAQSDNSFNLELTTIKPTTAALTAAAPISECSANGGADSATAIMAAPTAALTAVLCRPPTSANSSSANSGTDCCGYTLTAAPTAAICATLTKATAAPIASCTNRAVCSTDGGTDCGG